MRFTLLHIAFKLCSNFELFHQDKLKNIFENNGYPKSIVDLCIKKYLDKNFYKKEIVLKASKKEVIWVLPFTGKKLLQLRTRLVNSRIRSSIIKIPLRKRTTLTFYRYTCSNCNVTYYDKTYHLLQLDSNPESLSS